MVLYITINLKIVNTKGNAVGRKQNGQNSSSLRRTQSTKTPTVSRKPVNTNSSKTLPRPNKPNQSTRSGSNEQKEVRSQTLPRPGTRGSANRPSNINLRAGPGTRKTGAQKRGNHNGMTLSHWHGMITNVSTT